MIRGYPPIHQASRLFARSFVNSATKLTKSSPDIAFVFDIDGVLLRGSHPIPRAREAIELLNSNKVPYILLTNGGGISEKSRADFVSNALGLPISPLQLVQSHTPMKAFAKNNTFSRVMVVGGPQDKARKCAQEYGFKDVLMPIDIIRKFPEASPHHRFTQQDFEQYALKEIDTSKPLEAILVFNDPRDMGTDIQIVSDLLNSKGGLIGTKRAWESLENPQKPAIPIVFSNNDFIWANDYSLPRFGQGAFRIIIENLYREANRLASHQNLESTIMGKPFKIQYDFAHHILIDWLKNGSQITDQKLPELGVAPEASPFRKIYMVGDNPESDIKGANDHGWESLLLRTGVYKDQDWDNIIARPTSGVHDDVFDAVETTLVQNHII